MTLYYNAGENSRVWPWLTHPETSRTLELAPGETVTLDLEIEDQWLRPKPTTRASAKTPPPAPAEAPADPPKE